jgi:hypothetical protein
MDLSKLNWKPVMLYHWITNRQGKRIKKISQIMDMGENE